MGRLAERLTSVRSSSGAGHNLFRTCVSFLKVLSYQMHRCVVDSNFSRLGQCNLLGYSKSYF